MKRLLIIIILLFPIVSYSQGWVWQSVIQGGSYLKVVSVETHSDGRSFVLLEYAGNITVSGTTVSSVGGTNDIAVVAFAANGDFLWIQSIGSSDVEIAASMAIDETNACLYVNGDFKLTCSFGASASLTSDGLFDAFLAKYSLSGDLVYAKRIAWGTNSQRSVSLCVDNSGNVVATGLYLSSATFEGGNSLAGNAFTSNYIVKYNSAGSIQWVKGTLGKYNVTWFRDIKPYSGGYIIAGQFRDSLFLDVQTIVSQAANFDMFIYAIDNSGNGQWVRTIKGALGDDQINKIAVSDKIYISGIVKSDTLTIQTGPSTFVPTGIGNSGNFDFTVFAYTTAGNYSWHKKYGSAGDDRSVFVDANNTNLLVGGYYSAAITIESATPIYNAGAEGFQAVYSNDGTMSSLNSFNGSSAEYVRAVSFFTNGNYVVSGEFNSDVMTLGTASVTNGTTGNYAGFIAKYGCLESLSFTTAPACISGTNGSATVTASGGREPYTYIWSNGQTTQTALNLSSVTYRITVTDANGCSLSSSVAIPVTPNVSASVTAFTDNTCAGGNNGSVTVTASSGLTPYTYLWSSGQTINSITGLTAGTYSCTVTDACGTTATASKTLVLNSNLSANVSITNITCNGLSNGNATVNVTGNGSPFTYLWSTLATTSSITNLSTGTYTVTVTDVCGAKVIASGIVTQPTAITFDYEVSCTKRNRCIGWAKALPSGGTPGYTYLWSTNETSQTIINLCKGSYSVTVKDANNCTKVKANIRIKDCTVGTPPNDTTAIKEAESKNISIYPNPADNFINVAGKGEEKIVYIKLYDITGKQCFFIEEANIEDNRSSIDISKWERGLYMIVVNTDLGIITKQLIIE